MEVFEIVACEQGAECLNSLECARPGSALCNVCRFAPNAPSSYSSFWKPMDRKRLHPQQIAEKLAKKQTKHAEKKAQKQSVDKARRSVLKQAVRAEKATERNLIHATRNSGRTNRDGDHVAAGQITLDTKLQSKRENPVVLLEQLFKVREDAKRAGNSIGALVLRNANNVGVVAIHEDDFAQLVARIA